MRSLFILFVHLVITLARLACPGGVRAAAAESLAVKHQLLIMKRTHRRSPPLTGWDRMILGCPYRKPNPGGRVGRAMILERRMVELPIELLLVDAPA